ncbi:hypothetical protein ACFLWU_01160 [Chloroflexota bacterium]
MKRSRKLIIVALLGVVVLAGSISGIALANTEDEEVTQPEARSEALLDRVCDIYNTANPEAPIDKDALKDAFSQAGSELRDQGRSQFHQRLMDESKITEEQLNEFETWIESKPDFPTDQFKEWLESRPDDIPFGPGLRGDSGHRGFGKFGGGFPRFGGPCAPQTD